jgi:hypothetical protein
MSQHDLLSDDQLAAALQASRTLVDAPEHVVQRALALFAWREVATAVAPKPLLRRLLASLSFDSDGASPMAYGMRSGGGAVRQLLFTVEGRDIDLRISPADSSAGFVLSGQILGPDAQGRFCVEAANGDAAAAREAALNELGEFVLPELPAGAYHISLELNDMAIDLPPLNLPHEA